MKIRYFLFYFLLLPFALSAVNWSLDVGPAYYKPYKNLRDAYSGAWIDYQAEASYYFDCNTEVWFGLNWISKKHTKGRPVLVLDSCDCFDYVKDKRQIWILPLSFGAKYYYPITSCISVYLGGGLAWTFLRVERDCNFLSDHYSKNGLGAVIKSGIRYDWGKYTFVNLSCDYFHQTFNLSYSEKICINNRDFLNLSAYKIGLTLGVYF